MSSRRHLPPPPASCTPRSHSAPAQARPGQAPAAAPLHCATVQGFFPAGLPSNSIIQPSGSPQRQTSTLPPSFTLPGHGGSPLPDPLRQQMEHFFKADFSSVRVHVGPQPCAIGAQAFTVASRIYFAPGHYNPQTHQGRRLLGHELAHVVQQKAGRVPHPTGRGMVVVHDKALEAEADMAGMRAAMVSSPILNQAHQHLHQPQRSIQMMNLRASTKKVKEDRMQDEKYEEAKMNLTREERSKKRDAFKEGIEYKIPGFEDYVMKPVAKKNDKFGNRLFFGYRNECNFKSNYYEWAKNNVYASSTCSPPQNDCSDDWELDHIKSFYPIVDDCCSKVLTCDGDNHWQVYIYEWSNENLNVKQKIGLDKINGTNSVMRAFHLTDNHQWKCGHHNSSKGGDERDGTMLPTHVESCDGSCKLKKPKVLLYW